MGSPADAPLQDAGDRARVVVLGGNGAVGRLFARTLAERGATVALVDRDPAARADVRDLGPYLSADATAASAALRDLLSDAGCALLALPEEAALAALPHVLAALAPDALLVDTLSVKTPFVRAARAAASDVELLSLNPMFAPSLGFAGQAVLAVEVAPGPRAAALLALLRELADVVTVADEDAHDRTTAALQAAAHASLIALGLGLRELDVDVQRLLPVAPPPFAALLALVARIADGAPATYGDIQRANPHAAAARAALRSGLERLDAADDADAFATLLDDLAALLGPEREALAARAAALLAQARGPA